MNWIVSIFRMANSNWTSRIFTLVLILLGTYSATSIFKAKAPKQDCTVWQKQNEQCNEQNKQLIGAFIDIKRELAVVKPVSYYWNKEGYFEFAGFNTDTLPQRTKERQAVQKVMSKIDSILLKWKQDSILKSKQKTKT